MAEQQRQQTADQEGDTGEVTEAGLRKQVDRAGSEVSRHEKSSDQVPRAVKRVTPPESAPDELAPSAYAVPQQADRPDQLEGMAALPPLIEDHRGEGEAQHRGAQRQHDVERVHSPTSANDSTIATRTSFRNHPTC